MMEREVLEDEEGMKCRHLPRGAVREVGVRVWRVGGQPDTMINHRTVRSDTDIHPLPVVVRIGIGSGTPPSRRWTSDDAAAHQDILLPSIRERNDHIPDPAVPRGLNVGRVMLYTLRNDLRRSTSLLLVHLIIRNVYQLIPLRVLLHRLIDLRHRHLDAKPRLPILVDTHLIGLCVGPRLPFLRSHGMPAHRLGKALPDAI